MPPKNGPAPAATAAKKGTTSSASASSTADVDPGPPEPSETAEDTPAVDQTVEAETAEADIPSSEDAEVVEDDGKTVDQRARDDITKMYPADTEIWFGAVKGLWFGFPRITTITPRRQWLRQIYNLTETAQTFEWMVLAQVPMLMQARTDALTDDEYNALFNAWFTDAEVSLPK